MEKTYIDLVENIEKLRKNKENVPLQDLKTKFAKPYRDLICKIQKESEEILKICIFAGCRFGSEKEVTESGFLEASQKIIDEEKARGTFRKISREIFEAYDMQEAIRITADRVGTRIWYEAYPKIWLLHTHKVGFTYQNDLIGMEWNGTDKLWQKEEKGVVSWTIMLPPTEEEIEKDYRDECKRIQQKQSGRNVSTGYERRKQHTA